MADVGTAGLRGPAIALAHAPPLRRRCSLRGAGLQHSPCCRDWGGDAAPAPANHRPAPATSVAGGPRACMACVRKPHLEHALAAQRLGIRSLAAAFEQVGGHLPAGHCRKGARRGGPRQGGVHKRGASMREPGRAGTSQNAQAHACKLAPKQGRQPACRGLPRPSQPSTACSAFVIYTCPATACKVWKRVDTHPPASELTTSRADSSRRTRRP